MDHLAFVMDNWYLKEFALGNKDEIQYIIAAFNIEDESPEYEMLNKLEDQLQELDEMTDRRHNELHEIIKKQNVQQKLIEQVLNNQMSIMGKQFKM